MVFVELDKVKINKIKSQMALKGLTYGDMANVLGCKKGAFHSKIVGRRRFNQEELALMSKHFGVPIDYFFTD